MQYYLIVIIAICFGNVSVCNAQFDDSFLKERANYWLSLLHQCHDIRDLNLSYKSKMERQITCSNYDDYGNKEEVKATLEISWTDGGVPIQPWSRLGVSLKQKLVYMITQDQKSTTAPMVLWKKS